MRVRNLRNDQFPSAEERQHDARDVGEASFQLLLNIKCANKTNWDSATYFHMLSEGLFYLVVFQEALHFVPAAFRARSEPICI